MEQVLRVWDPGQEEVSASALRGAARHPDIMGQALSSGSGGAVFPGEEDGDAPGAAVEAGGEEAMVSGVQAFIHRHLIMAVLPMAVLPIITARLPMPNPRRKRSVHFWKSNKRFFRRRLRHSGTESMS